MSNDEWEGLTPRPGPSQSSAAPFALPVRTGAGLDCAVVGDVSSGTFAGMPQGVTVGEKASPGHDAVGAARWIAEQYRDAPCFNVLLGEVDDDHPCTCPTCGHRAILRALDPASAPPHEQQNEPSSSPSRAPGDEPAATTAVSVLEQIRAATEDDCFRGEDCRGSMCSQGEEPREMWCPACRRRTGRLVALDVAIAALRAEREPRTSEARAMPDGWLGPRGPLSIHTAMVARPDFGFLGVSCPCGWYVTMGAADPRANPHVGRPVPSDDFGPAAEHYAKCEHARRAAPPSITTEDR